MDSSDIHEVLQDIASSNDLIVQKLIKAPAFITTYLDAIGDENVLFVHKKPQKTESFDVSNSFENTCHSPDTSMSYIGQPLECPFSPSHNISLAGAGDIKELVKKETIEPIALSLARKCGAMYTFKSDEKLPLWLFCDALDPSKTFLMSISTNNCWRTRSWGTLHSWNFEDRDIDKLITKHSKLFNVPKTQNRLLVTSTYVPDSDATNQALLKITWTTPSIDIPFPVAKTKLMINFTVGFPESMIKPFWDQLQLLQKFMDLIAVKQEANLENLLSANCPLNTLNESDKSARTIDDKLNALLRESNHGVPYSHLSSSEAQEVKENSFLTVVEETIENRRQAMDFTDKIWNILKDCSTCFELRKYLEIIFHQIRKGTLTPIIQRSNGTRLAHKIRCLMADSAYDFELTVNPLEYLIELGIEKLKNDFLNIFSAMITHNAKLSMPSLPSFKDMKSSEKSLTELSSQWLVWLGRLYTSLEVFILTQLQLNLKCQSMDPNFLAIVNQILEHYSTTESHISSLPWLLNNRNHSCQIDIETPLVKDVLKHKRFEEWKLTLTHDAENSKYQSSFLCCDQNKFPASIIEPDIGNLTLNCTAIAPQSTYVCSSLHTVADLF